MPPARPGQEPTGRLGAKVARQLKAAQRAPAHRRPGRAHHRERGRGGLRKLAVVGIARQVGVGHGPAFFVRHAKAQVDFLARISHGRLLGLDNQARGGQGHGKLRRPQFLAPPVVQRSKPRLGAGAGHGQAQGGVVAAVAQAAALVDVVPELQLTRVGHGQDQGVGGPVRK